MRYVPQVNVDNIHTSLIGRRQISAARVEEPDKSVQRPFQVLFSCAMSGLKEIGELLQATLIAAAKSIVDFVTGARPAHVSIRWLTNDRFYAYLVFALSGNGPLGCKAGSVYRIWKLLPVSVFLRLVRVNWRHPRNGIVLSEEAGEQRTVHINRHYYSSAAADNRLFMPYYAHPDFYKSGIYEHVCGMRSRYRNIRIFFSGTYTEKKYSSDFAFPILNRPKILKHIGATFRSTISQEVPSTRDDAPFVFITPDNVTDHMSIAHHRLALKEYISVMAQSDFFICPPGWLMPHSHNLIEAMSVGTIPITNYAAYMRPPLTPDRDCLAFSNLTELEAVIRRALNMHREEINFLRKGVIRYYDEHLCPKTFGRDFWDRLPSISELVVNDESAR